MRKFLIVLIILCVIFLVAYGIFAFIQIKGGMLAQTGTQTMQEESDDMQAVEVVPQLSIDDAAKQIKDTYKEDPAFQQCIGEVVESCLSNVIAQRIAADGDVSLCDDFITEDAQKGCKGTYTMRIAREQKDATVCKSLDDQYRSICEREALSARAVEQKNVDVCNELGENDRVVCVSNAARQLAMSTGDEGWCDRLEDGEKSFCVEEVQFAKLEEQRIKEERERIEQEQEEASQQVTQEELDAQNEQDQEVAQEDTQEEALVEEPIVEENN